VVEQVEQGAVFDLAGGAFGQGVALAQGDQLLFAVFKQPPFVGKTALEIGGAGHRAFEPVDLGKQRLEFVRLFADLTRCVGKEVVEPVDQALPHRDILPAIDGMGGSS